MVAPSFFCQSETANGLLLRYRSRRRGFVPYVIGQIREVARLYYDTALTVEVLSADGGPETVDDSKTGTGSLQYRELLTSIVIIVSIIAFLVHVPRTHLSFLALGVQ